MKSAFKSYQMFSHMSKLSNGQFQIVLVSGAKYVNEIDQIAKTMNSLLMTCKFVYVRYICSAIIILNSFVKNLIFFCVRFLE